MGIVGSDWSNRVGRHVVGSRTRSLSGKLPRKTRLITPAVNLANWPSVDIKSELLVSYSVGCGKTSLASLERVDDIGMSLAEGRGTINVDDSCSLSRMDERAISHNISKPAYKST